MTVINKGIKSVSKSADYYFSKVVSSLVLLLIIVYQSSGKF
jgi:hypothetical protein